MPFDKKIRVKRQNYKPSIDGSMLANERVNLLKRLQNELSSTTSTAATTTTIATPQQQIFKNIKNLLEDATKMISKLIN